MSVVTLKRNQQGFRVRKMVKILTAAEAKAHDDATEAYPTYRTTQDEESFKQWENNGKHVTNVIQMIKDRLPFVCDRERRNMYNRE